MGLAPGVLMTAARARNAATTLVVAEPMDVLVCRVLAVLGSTKVVHAYRE